MGGRTGQHTRRGVAFHAVVILALLVLGLRHAQTMLQGSEHLHLQILIGLFDWIDAGRLWVRGEELGNTGLYLGGPLYAWLSYPARLLSDNPMLGLHLTYMLVEAACLLVWFYTPTAPALSRRARLVSGLALALMVESKVFICQNDTLMGMLAVPLFVTFLWAIRSTSWRAMALPGVLAGLAVCLHQMALFLLPAMGVTLLVRREMFLPRAAAGIVGMLATVALFTVPGLVMDNRSIVDGPPVQMGGDVLAFALSFCTNMVGYPTALVGALLVGLALARRQQVLSGEQLALIWFLVGGASLILLLALRQMAVDPMSTPPPTYRDVRFAMINPARAVLMAAALLWLYDRAAQALERRSLPRPTEAQATAVAAVVSMVVLALLVARGVARLEQEWALQTVDGRIESPRRTSTTFMLHDSLSRDPAVIAGKLPDPMGPLFHLDLAAAVKWRHFSPLRPQLTGTSGPNIFAYRALGERSGSGGLALPPGPPWDTVALVPRLRGADLEKLPGVRQHGPMLVMTRALLLTPVIHMGHLSGADHMELVGLDYALAERNLDRLLVALERGAAEPELTLAVEPPRGERLEVTAGISAHSSLRGTTLSYYLFDLSRGGAPLRQALEHAARPGGRLTLEVQCLGRCPINLSVLQLPPRQPRGARKP